MSSKSETENSSKINLINDFDIQNDYRYSVLNFLSFSVSKKGDEKDVATWLLLLRCFLTFLNAFHIRMVRMILLPFCMFATPIKDINISIAIHKVYSLFFPYSKTILLTDPDLLETKP